MSSYSKGIDFYGEKELLDNLAKLAKQYPKIASRAVFKEGYKVFGDAQLMTPARYGYLRGTAYTKEDRTMDGVPFFEIIYPAKYALFVHEMPDPTESGKSVNWNAAGTGSKFLERPLKWAAMGMAQRMSDYINKKIDAEFGK